MGWKVVDYSEFSVQFFGSMEVKSADRNADSGRLTCEVSNGSFENPLKTVLGHNYEYTASSGEIGTKNCL